LAGARARQNSQRSTGEALLGSDAVAVGGEIEQRIQTGHVIFLNGTSSSGKITIAKGLQEALDELYIRASLDVFLHQLPDS